MFFGWMPGATDKELECPPHGFRVFNSSDYLRGQYLWPFCYPSFEPSYGSLMVNHSSVALLFISTFACRAPKGHFLVSCPFSGKRAYRIVRRLHLTPFFHEFRFLLCPDHFRAFPSLVECPAVARKGASGAYQGGLGSLCGAGDGMGTPTPPAPSLSNVNTPTPLPVGNLRAVPGPLP